MNAVQAREARAFATKHRLRTGSGRVYLDSEHYVEGDLRDPAFRAAVEKMIATRPREVKKVERRQQPEGFGSGGAGGVPPFLQGFTKKK